MEKDIEEWREAIEKANKGLGTEFMKSLYGQDVQNPYCPVYHISPRELVYGRDYWIVKKSLWQKIKQFLKSI